MLIGVASARADGCSNATLQGSYSVSVTGELLGTLAGTPPVLTPFPTPSKTDGVLIFSFDGAGHSDILGFVVRNGVQAALGLPELTENGFQPQTGTYTVALDCTGTGTIVQTNMSFSYAFVTGPHGRTFKYVTKSGHAALIPNNPNCVAPAGCDLALNQIAIGEQITR
jgi:hypothetical protein